MPEPFTIGVGAAVAAYLGKDGIQRVLGPTADYLGQELETLARKRMENLGRILRNAEGKLESDSEGKGVSPRVLKSIVNDGSYADDDVIVDYFGGVLASSKTNSMRDDRGVRLLKLVENLSSYQLRAHYLVYSTLSNIYKGQSKPIEEDREREKLEIFIPYGSFMMALDLNEEEACIPELMTHIFSGLGDESLIRPNWAIGRVDALKTVTTSEKVQSVGIVCSPSILGIELFMWAFGCGNKDSTFLFSEEFNPGIDGIARDVEGSFSTYDRA